MKEMKTKRIIWDKWGIQLLLSRSNKKWVRAELVCDTYHQLEILIEKLGEDQFRLIVRLWVNKFDPQRCQKVVVLKDINLALHDIIRFTITQELIWGNSCDFCIDNWTDMSRLEENKIDGFFGTIHITDATLKWFCASSSMMFRFARGASLLSDGKGMKFLYTTINLQELIGEGYVTDEEMPKYIHTIIPKGLFDAWMAKVLDFISFENIPKQFDYITARCEISTDSVLKLMNIWINVLINAEEYGAKYLNRLKFDNGILKATMLDVCHKYLEEEEE